MCIKLNSDLNKNVLYKELILFRKRFGIILTYTKTLFWNSLSEICPNVVTACNILLKTPVMVASAERSLSKFKIIKNYF